MSIVPSPSKKADQNGVHAINDLLQCSMPSADRRMEKDSTKCGHLISQAHNKEVKWYVKSCIVLTKNVIKALRHKLVECIMKHSNVS